MPPRGMYNSVGAWGAAGSAERAEPTSRRAERCVTVPVPPFDRLRGPVFEIARTEAGFAQVGIDPEGHTVCWPGGADLAPDVMSSSDAVTAWPGIEAFK